MVKRPELDGLMTYYNDHLTMTMRSSSTEYILTAQSQKYSFYFSKIPRLVLCYQNFKNIFFIFQKIQKYLI